MPLATLGQLWDKRRGWLESSRAGHGHQHGWHGNRPGARAGRGSRSLANGPREPGPARTQTPRTACPPCPRCPRCPHCLHCPPCPRCPHCPHCLHCPRCLHLMDRICIFLYLRFIKSKWKCLHRLVASLISKHRLIVGWSRDWGCQPSCRHGPGWQLVTGTEWLREEPRSPSF